MEQAVNALRHSHNFLGSDHARNEWRAWLVIKLCASAMIVEITCGVMFGSLALIADGIHMSTHSLAFLITACAYSYSRHKAENPNFVFGTGKVGELSSFTCAIILIGVAIYILYDGISRFVYPATLHFKEALPVAFVGLSVNIASALILFLPCGSESTEDLMAHGHNHGHSHGHSHGHNGFEFLEDFEKNLWSDIPIDHHDEVHDHGHHHSSHDQDHDHDHGHGHHHMGHAHDQGHCHDHHVDKKTFDTSFGQLSLSIFEDDIQPEFRLELQKSLSPSLIQRLSFAVKTKRVNETEDVYQFEPFLDDVHHWRSTKSIPEPHSFDIDLTITHENGIMENFVAQFREFGEEDTPIDLFHTGMSDITGDNKSQKKMKYELDNNFRGALLHVIADAFVSVIAIIAIALAGTVDGCQFLDPLAGILGAFVIISWGWQLAADTSVALLDIAPDLQLRDRMMEMLEADSTTKVTDLHIWKLGPGKLGLILSIATNQVHRGCAFYRRKLAHIKSLSHVTVEVHHVSDELIMAEQGHDHFHGHSHV